MRSGMKQEFMCPYCSGVNTFTTHERSALMEEYITCTHCKRIMNVTAAAGIDDDVNIVVFEHEQNSTPR